MFFSESVSLPEPAAAVQPRLERLLGLADGLQELSSQAYSEAADEMEPVQLAGVWGTLSVQRLAPYPSGPDLVVPIRWLVSGPLGRLLPVLDADLELSPAGESETVIRLRGSYRPPLGAIGERMDEVLLHRFALASVRSFVRRIAEVAADDAALGRESRGCSQESAGGRSD